MPYIKPKVKSFLNTQEWADFQLSLGRKATRIQNDAVQAVLITQDSWFGQHYTYIPHGPVVDFNAFSSGINNGIRAFIKEAKDFADTSKSFFILAEPLDDSVAQALASNGFKVSNSKHLQPSKTVVLDVSKSTEDLLKEMHHKTRYNIKVAERDGVIVKESEDIEVFLKLLKKTTERDQFQGHGANYYHTLFNRFRGEGELQLKIYVAYHNEAPAAAALVMLWNDHAYYLHGASDHALRKHMAPYALHWQIVQSVKLASALSYDFWGIDHARYPGVTRFKLSWGGQVVEYPGAFVLPLRKPMYWLYSFMRFIKSKF